MFGHSNSLRSKAVRGLAALSLVIGAMAVAVPKNAVHADNGTCFRTPTDSNGFSADICGFIQLAPDGGNDAVIYGCTATIRGGVVVSTGVACGLLDPSNSYVKCCATMATPGITTAATSRPETVAVQSYHLCSRFFYQLSLSGPVVDHPCAFQSPL